MNESRFEDVRDLRRQLRRYQLYLGVTFAAFGVVALSAMALTGYYGVHFTESLSKAEARVTELQTLALEKDEALERGLLRQQEDLAAIQKAAVDDLEAIREMNRKLESVRDPSPELSALREANERLWKELASQRTELLERLQRREEPVAAPAPKGPRFRLGQTRIHDPAEKRSAIQGFEPGNENVMRATEAEKNPLSLLIELQPEEVRPGDPFQLNVRLVNQSNRLVALESLRLDWSFQGKRTGGRVPVAILQVGPRQTELLYSLVGDWTEAHEHGPASVTAALTIPGGASVTNDLSW